MPRTAGRPRNNNPVFVDNDIDAEHLLPTFLGSGGELPRASASWDVSSEKEPNEVVLDAGTLARGLLQLVTLDFPGRSLGQ